MLTPFLNVNSLLLGLAAWYFGLVAVRNRRVSLRSFSCCVFALVLQLIELTHRARIGDVSAILDTVRAITLAALTLSAGTVLLNTIALLRGRR